MQTSTLELTGIDLFSVLTIIYLIIFATHYIEGSRGLLPFTWIRRQSNRSTHTFILCLSLGVVISALGNFLLSAFTGHSFLRTTSLGYLGARLDFVYLNLIVLITLAVNYRLVFPVNIYNANPTLDKEYSIEGIIRYPIRTHPLTIRGVVVRQHSSGIRKRLIL